MKEKISKTCLEYMGLKAEGHDKDARKLLEALPKEDFTVLYISGLNYLKDVLEDHNSPYILVEMAKQYFIEHQVDFSDIGPDDLSCYVIDGFIYHMMETFRKHQDYKNQNPFAEELLNDSDPEVAAVGREILKGGC